MTEAEIAALQELARELGLDGWVIDHDPPARCAVLRPNRGKAVRFTLADDAGEYLRNAAFRRDVVAIASVLRNHGGRFAGNDPMGLAEEWADHGFVASQVEEWAEIGCWDAATATVFRDGGLSPKAVADVVAGMVDSCENPTEEYTDGDPVYAACNGDLDPEDIVAVCRAAGLTEDDHARDGRD